MAETSTNSEIRQQPPVHVPPPLSKTQLLAFFGMIVGMFMAILDIQIVASSLSAIAAGLSASPEELSWVQTSYLIAEVIIIPMTGFMARCFSTRISFFVAAFGFTIMSFLCALAWNIESMIIFRALQGFFGGAMIPTIFGIVFLIFPQEKQPMVSVIIGLVVTIAPTMGPTVGGYITDLFSWHFMFLLNIIPGIFVCVVVFLYADFDQPNYDLLKNFDYAGIILLALSLGTMQYVLEEGNKKGWLEDSLILYLTIITAISFVLLFARELTFPNPILDFSAFTSKNFVFGCIYSFVIGVGLYGVVYIMPIFLFTVAGFNTIQIGLTMIVTGVAQFCSAPIVGRIAASGLDLRIVLGIGLSVFGLGCYLNSFLTPDSKFFEFLIPQIVRGGALIFCFLPVNNIALGTIPKEKVQNASGLYNLNRNLGGAIGLAAIASSITSNTKIFSQYINENIQIGSLQAEGALKGLQHLLAGKVTDPVTASHAILSFSVTKNAYVIAINHVFATIGVMFMVTTLLLPFTTSIKITKGASNSGH